MPTAIEASNGNPQEDNWSKFYHQSEFLHN